jgi:hypothetical protein
MKLIGLIAAAFAMTATAAAQDAVPSLMGAWKGTGKILLYGTTEHLSGSAQNAVVRDLEVTHRVEGQDGHREQRQQGAVCVCAFERQQNHRRRGHGRLLPDHDHVARSDREMLRPERRQSQGRDRGHLFHDGSRQTIRRNCRGAPTR